MPSYKLTYFNARGAAELLRLCFKQAEVEFEDFRIAIEEWPTFKPGTYFFKLQFKQKKSCYIYCN